MMRHFKELKEKNPRQPRIVHLPSSNIFRRRTNEDLCRHIEVEIIHHQQQYYKKNAQGSLSGRKKIPGRKEIKKLKKKLCG